MPRGIPNKPKPKTVIDERENPIDAPTLGEAMTAKPVHTESVEPAVTKKGRRSWGRRDILGVTKKNPAFTYRWVRKEAGNVARKLSEGWEFVSDTVNEKAINSPTESMYAGVNLTSNQETRDSILMRLPNDLKAERDEWLNEENAKVNGMIQRDISAEKNSGAIKGGVQIQGAQFKNIIE